MPKREKRNKKDTVPDMPVRDLADPYQMYAILDKALGACRFNSHCEDGADRIVHIPGTMRNKNQFKMFPGDMVLISIREFQADKRGDILAKYAASQVRILKKNNLIPSSLLMSAKDTDNDADQSADNIPFDFETI